MTTTRVGLDVITTNGAGGPTRLAHGLGGHPAFGGGALQALAATVPDAWVSAFDGRRATVDTRPTRLAGDAAGLAQSIADNGCRLTLYHLEHVAPYRDLLADCVDEWERTTGQPEGGTVDRQANVFYASPGAVVPAHFDRHHNLLLQIEGTKVLTVGTFPDPVETRRETEREFDQGHHGIATLPPEQTTFHLGPGDGVYIPAYAFHWVNGGSDVSVAMSCGFSTRVTARYEAVHLVNRRLRLLGLPTPLPGQSRALDAGKVAIFRATRHLRRRVR